MRVILVCLSFSIAFLAFFMIKITVTASTTEALAAREIVKRAEIIVLGTYDFSDKPMKRDFIYQLFEFQVTAIYKGEASPMMKVGMDSNDIGWAKTFQENGGEFLLCLTYDSKLAEYLVPVVGANGLIPILDGEVQLADPNKAYFETLLKNPIEIFERKTISGFQKSLYMLGGLLVVLLVSYLLLRQPKRIL